MSSKGKFAALSKSAAKRVNEGKKQAEENEAKEETEPIKQEQPINVAWTQFADQTQKKLGRPPGKRSKDDYRQVTAYIKRDTYRKIQRTLFDSEAKQDFSDLVEMLLVKYLDEQ